MSIDPRNDPSEQNWRLKADLEVADRPRALERLVGSLRSPAILEELEASVPPGMVITHDGMLLFAYASDQRTLQATRDAIESVSGRDGTTVINVRLSHWDSTLDDWRQIEPPPASLQERQAQETAEHDAVEVETRTLVASIGKLIRAEVERSLLEWASELGVQCEIVEHPHLLADQVGFTVTGPKRKVDEFSQGLKAEE